jgi:hypothetical protein
MSQVAMSSYFLVLSDGGGEQPRLPQAWPTAATPDRANQAIIALRNRPVEARVGGETTIRSGEILFSSRTDS